MACKQWHFSAMNIAAITPHTLAIPFAIGLATGNADFLQLLGIYLPEWLVCPCTALLITLAVIVVVTAFLCIILRPAHWPLRTAVVLVTMACTGWCMMMHEWHLADNERHEINTLGTDNHIALVVSPPIRYKKTFCATVEMDNGIRASIFIPHELAIATDADTLLSSSSDNNGCLLHEGQTIIFSSRLKSNLDNVTTNDYSRYQLHNNIAATGFVTALRMVDIPRMGLLFQLKTYILRRLHSLHLPQQVTALAKALTLADRSSLTADTRTTFQRAGAAHLLALSGMHLSLLLYLLYFICGHSLMHALRNGIFMASVIWAYVILTGAPYSLLRAATMLTIYFSVQVLKRNTTHTDMIMLALLILLIASPHALFDVGFQLSFVCVYAIVAVNMPKINRENNMDKKSKAANYNIYDKIYHKVVGCIWISFLCTVVTAPIVAYYFGYIPIYGCISGLLLIPLTFAIIPLMVVTIFFPLPIFCNILVFLINLQTAIAEWFGGLPFAVLEF